VAGGPSEPPPLKAAVAEPEAVAAPLQYLVSFAVAEGGQTGGEGVQVGTFLDERGQAVDGFEQISAAASQIHPPSVGLA